MGSKQARVGAWWGKQALFVGEQHFTEVYYIRSKAVTRRKAAEHTRLSGNCERGCASGQVCPLYPARQVQLSAQSHIVFLGELICGALFCCSDFPRIPL